MEIIKSRNFYDVIIIGAGVTGTSVLNMLSKYTNVSRIAIMEKNSSVALVNSNPKNNSHTLHFGDNEVAYPLKKALELKAAAEMIVAFVKKYSLRRGLFYKNHKMVLGVGEEEVDLLHRRFCEFRDYYPKLHLLDRVQIKEIEPKVIEGRPVRPVVAAMMSDDGYAINYQILSELLFEEAMKSEKRIDAFFNTEVNAVSKDNYGFFKISSSRGDLISRAAYFASGPYSLGFAQMLGYGTNLEILPVAGSFYFSQKAVNGKVYTVNRKDVPYFAAPHADPDVTNPAITRFGPTAKMVLLMERRNLKTFIDFMKTPIKTARGRAAIGSVLFHEIPHDFVIKNMLYDIPVLGKALYLNEAVRKIIPSMRYSDLHIGRGLGGIRPQVVDMQTRKLLMGEAKIVEDGGIFNTTPSPGASSSLRSGEEGAREIVKHLGGNYFFDEEKFIHDYGPRADLNRVGNAA